MFARRVLCGIQPSSVPHIGNYLGSFSREVRLAACSNLLVGAVKKWIDLQNSGDSLIVMLADLHAVTLPRDPEVLRYV